MVLSDCMSLFVSAWGPFSEAVGYCLLLSKFCLAHYLQVSQMSHVDTTLDPSQKAKIESIANLAFLHPHFHSFMTHCLIGVPQALPLGIRILPGLIALFLILVMIPNSCLVYVCKTSVI